MNNKQVAHLWANQSRNSASGSNFFFEGSVLYSYGYHFVVGVIIEHKGTKYALLNSNKRSATTQQHISYARSASSHLTHFYVDLEDRRGYQNSSYLEFNSSWLTHGMIERTMLYYKEKAESAFKSSIKAKQRKSAYLDECAEAIDTGNRFLETFREFAPKGMRKLKMPNAKAMEVERKKAAKLEAKHRYERAIRVAERKARMSLEFNESLAEWKVFNTRYVTHGEAFPIHLRFNSMSNEVQTSRGADVPYDSAKDLYLFAYKFRSNPDVIKQHINGRKVGDFTVTSMNDEGITIGCHFIEWSVIDEFAKEQGWVEVEDKISA